MRYSNWARFALLLTSVSVLRSAEPPKLGLVIVIDQFRYDYIERFSPYFVQDGFRRLLDGGATYQECYYRHAVTKTAPGHATILSGVHANVHGIVGNDWLDRSTWQTMVSVQDPNSPIVGGAVGVPHSPGGLLEAQSGRSPRNFLAYTVGDQLKMRFGANSHVISVSNKDRAAILLGGRMADGAYWTENGRFVTSAYYRAALPSWVEQFDAGSPIDKYFGKTWDRLLKPEPYNFTQGPDDAAGESTMFGLSRVFPKRIDGGHPEIRQDFYDAFDVSPFSIDALEEFAEKAIADEAMGKHPHPDLFCVSFSQIDHVGHEFGPDSHEMMDSVLRLDRAIARLLAVVDRQVGLKNCIVVLTADHGAAPLPERLNAFGRGGDAARFHGPQLDAAVDKALTAAFGPPPAGDFWVRRDNFGYILHTPTLEAKHLRLADAERVVKEEVLRFPEIAYAYLGDELAGGHTLLSSNDGDTGSDPEGDTVDAMSRRSYFPGRSADVVFVLKPYVSDRTPFGVNHGTPWAFDTHVPMVWYGQGVTPGVHLERVAVEDLAPTLCAILQVPRPPQATGRRLF